jgi:putative transcriptional regulator
MIGSLLVAPPAQEDEFWSKTVVFLYEKNKAATVGLIVNKPSDRTLRELAEHHDIDYTGDEVIHIGGPVNPSALVMLHTDDWACSNTMPITSTFRVSSDKSMLQRLCSGDRPRHWRLFLGMSAWTNGQLENELAGLPPFSKKAAWLTAPATEALVFSNRPDKVWMKSIEGAADQLVQNYFSID